MIAGIWGKKIGMTQLFAQDKVVPVTAIDLGNWLTIGNKTIEKDGYNAIQIGCLRSRYQSSEFKPEWLKKLKTYFQFVREIKVEDVAQFEIGKAVDVYPYLTEGHKVDVAGNTRGRGFAGVVKRHDFNGPPASHGSTMGKKTGSLSFMRSRGRVIKGKRMAGHMGNIRQMMRNLDIAKVEKNENVIFVKGSIPGHSGTLVFIRRHAHNEK